MTLFDQVEAFHSEYFWGISAMVSVRRFPPCARAELALGQNFELCAATTGRHPTKQCPGMSLIFLKYCLDTLCRIAAMSHDGLKADSGSLPLTIPFYRKLFSNCQGFMLHYLFFYA